MRTDSLNSSSEICISEGNILKYIGPIRAERNVSRPENVLIDQLLINMTSYVHKIFCWMEHAGGCCFLNVYTISVWVILLPV